MELTSLESNWNNQMCRICASNSNSFIPIFEGDGLEHQLPLKIQKYLPIEVSENDSLPRIMCFQCASTLISWNELVVKCIEADKKLRKYLNDEPEETKDSECFGESTAVDSDAGDDITGDNFFEEDKKPIPSPTPVPKKETNVKGRKPKLKRKKSVSDKETGNKEADLKEQEETDIIRSLKIDVPHSSNQVFTDFPKDEFLQYDKSNEFNETDHYGCKFGNLKNELSNNHDILLNPEVTYSDKEDTNDREIFECDTCGKILASRENMRVHLRIHTGERPFFCHFCGKRFKAPSGIQRHIKEFHERIRKFICNFCGRGFVNKLHMIEHERIHTGEKPYICDVCGKTVRTKASLYIHKRSHTDNFPHICSYCNKGFRTATSMSQHVLIHTGDKPFECDLCGKKFRMKNELKRHKDTHIDSKPFSCDFCGQLFKVKRYLKTHVRKHHSISVVKSN